MKSPSHCFLFAAALALGSLSHLPAEAPATVAFPNSIHPVSAWTQPGSPNPNQPFVVDGPLTAAESASPINFEIALKMRNIAELEARINKGEHVSPQELDAKYNPLPSDQKALAAWLLDQGFTITQRSTLALFAGGTIGQVEKAMQVRFAHVSFGGQISLSAITPPHLPASFAAAVLGITGLQPYAQPQKN